MIGISKATMIRTRIVNIFRLTCVLATVSIVLFWIYKYNLNLDLCRVDFRYYHHSKLDVFPVLSMCFMNPFLQDRLINYDSNVTMDLDYYITGVYTQNMNGTYHYRDRKKGEKLIIPSYNGFWFDRFYKCYDLIVPQEKHIQGFGLKFRTDEFENGNVVLKHLTFCMFTLNIIVTCI